MENELFEKTPVPKAYFTLALPLVFSMIVTMIYNMVDTYFIAKTGNTDMVAGVSLTAPIFTLMLALGDIFGLGGSSVISRLLGKQKEDDGRRLSVFCFYAALICGVAVAAVMMLLRGPILALLGAGHDTMVYASQYFTFIVLGSPFIILSLTPSNLVRAEGAAAASMVGTVLGMGINIILNPIFISVLGLGAAGSAIATVIGYVFTDLYFIWFLLKRSKRLSIDPKLFRASGREIRQIFAVGIPASVTNLMQSLGVILINRFLLPYGTVKVAAMGIVMKVNLIAVLILVGFAFGAQPLIGYSYGAGNYARFRKILRCSYFFECCFAVLLTAMLSFFAPALIRVFMNDAEIVSAGTVMLRVQLISMVFVAVVLVTTCTFQSAGKAFSAFLLSVGRQGVVLAAVLFFASRIAGYSGIIASQAVSDLLTAGLAVVLYYTGVHREVKRGMPQQDPV